MRRVDSLEKPLMFGGIGGRMRRETVETVRGFILGAPKSLQMVTAVLKLKDACSLEEKQ